ncbi:hypothetical protein PybrP1_007262 [[Pythium] brassicae (nom. inval.)]|nr:hypothetical protein PybrP1_007262 [[Pythium] brassicae (nom. inval.)]
MLSTLASDHTQVSPPVITLEVNDDNDGNESPRAVSMWPPLTRSPFASPMVSHSSMNTLTPNDLMLRSSLSSPSDGDAGASEATSEAHSFVVEASAASHSNATQHTVEIVVLCGALALVVLPLCLLKNLSALKVSSCVGFVLSLYLVLAFGYRSLDPPPSHEASWTASGTLHNGNASGSGLLVSSFSGGSSSDAGDGVVNIIRLAADRDARTVASFALFARAVSIYNFAFMMHLNLLPLFVQLRVSACDKATAMGGTVNASAGSAARRIRPIRTARSRMAAMVSSVACLCVLLYISLGVYGAAIKGNMLLSLQRDRAMAVPLVAFYVTVLVTLPLLFHPLRCIVEELVFKNRDSGGDASSGVGAVTATSSSTTVTASNEEEEATLDTSTDVSFARRLAVTLALLGSALAVATHVSNVEVIFSLVGATTCTLVCFAFPVAIFTRVFPWRQSTASVSVLTAPADCAEPTLQIQDATDVAVLCGGQVAARAQFAGVTSLQVGVLAPSLVMKALVSDTLASLVVHSGNASERHTFTGTRRVLEFDAGFSELHALTSLTFMNVNFKAPNVTLKTPDSLVTLTVDGTNAVDVQLTVLPGTSVKLQLLDLYANAFPSIPRCLYARQYGANTLKANVEVLGKTFEVMDAASFQTLRSNLVASGSSFELSTGCNFNTGLVEASGGRIRDGFYKVCDAATVIGAVPAASLNASTPAPTATTTGAAGGSKSSSTTLIALLVVIATVVLALVAYLARRHLKSATSPRAANRTNENAVNLINKVDTTTSGKLVLLSSDETLRSLKLEEPVQLTRPAGAGRLWVGEYLRQKVVVKRVEAENSETFTTKSLMNQACFLAQLSHPNIVGLKGVTWVAGTDFAVVAEFLNKDNLKTVLSDPDVELDTEAKLGMCLEVARALVYLHSSERNMYVRHLSSRKVLVKGSSLGSSSSSRGTNNASFISSKSSHAAKHTAFECKVNLFDCYPCVKKITPAESYGSGDLVWLAPEIITRTFPMDPKKANIYAFGVLMGEILSRVSPFQTLADERGNTLADLEISRRVHAKEPLVPHENHPEYMWAPQSLRSTIEACLSPSPSDRPTAEDIIIALQDAKVEEIAASLRTGGDFFV